MRASSSNTPLHAALEALQIRPDELGRSARLFLYLFLVSVVFTTGRTARDALFLSAYPLKWLPFMFFGFAAGAAIAIPVHARLAARFARTRYNAGFALAVAASYGLAFVLVKLEWSPVYPLLYVWVEVTNNLLFAQFWTLTTDMHNPREAKRLFGPIGSGRMTGLLVCGLTLGAVVGFSGTPALLLVNAVFLVLVAFVVAGIGKRYPTNSTVAHVMAPRRRAAEPEPAVYRSAYTRWILLLVAASFVVVTVADYQFKMLSRLHYSDDKLAAFFAVFYAGTGIIALLFHVFASARLLAALGLAAGLLLMPVLMGLSSVALLATGGALAAAVALKFSDNALQFTIQDSALQLLHYPLGGRMKARLRSAIEGAMKPVGYALGALVLVLVAPHLSPARLALVSLPVIAFWCVAAWVVRNRYGRALVDSLAHRNVEAGVLGLSSSAEVLRALEASARGPHHFQAEFALAELAELDPGSARRVATALLGRRDRRGLALACLGRVGTDAAALRRHLDDPDAEVRLAALWSYAALAHEDALDEIAPRLETAEPREADAACGALIREAGLDGVLVAGEHLRHLLRGSEAERLRGATILGDAHVQEFHRPVRRLLADPSLAVRRAAVQAAGRMGGGRLTADLLGTLEERGLSTVATEALEQLGESALPLMSAALADPTRPLAVRRRLPRIIRRIARPEALSALWRVAGDPDERLRLYVLHHASRMQDQWAMALDVRRIDTQLQLEGKTATQCLERWRNLEAMRSHPLAREALERSLYYCGRRVLSLLRLRYGSETIGRIRYNLESGEVTPAANALEALDTLVSGDERAWVVALLDSSARERAAEVLRARFPAAAETPEVSLARVLAGPDTYLAAVIARAHWRSEPLDAKTAASLAPGARGAFAEELLAACLRLGHDPTPVMQAVATDPESHRQVTALLAAWRSQHEDRLMLTTLERVLFLKGVPLFVQVPGDDLVGLAQEAIIERHAPGTDVFQVGDPGDAMFLVVQGRVRVHVGQKELAVLGPTECFGEMAILDQAPRSATVTVLEPLTVLKITQEDFFEILSDRPEIARGVFQVLTTRLRNMNEQLAKLAAA